MRNDSINTFSDFLTSFNGYRKKRKTVKDEKKLRGAVDKSSSEQHFRKLDTIIFVVGKIWSHTPSASGSYGSLAVQQAGRPAVRRNKGRFENFWNPLLIALLGILRRFTKVQCYCSVTNVFQSFSSGKAYCEACCGGAKKWDTMFFHVDPYY